MTEPNQRLEVIGGIGGGVLSFFFDPGNVHVQVGDEFLGQPATDVDAARTDSGYGVERSGRTMATRRREQKTRRMEDARYAELERMLLDRRREIGSAVQEKMREVRADGAGTQPHGVVDDAEMSESDIQDDIELALIQMKAETLTKIDEALDRLEDGRYGYCFECGDEIAEQRLRALPFAVRCRDCEEEREVAAQRDRVLAQRRGGASLFPHLSR